MVYGVGSLLSGLAPSVRTLIASRVVQGVGGAMIFGTGVAILTSVFPPQERGRVLGLNVAAVYVGLSVGPFLGGVLTQQWGWRSIFFLNVPLVSSTAIPSIIGVLALLGFGFALFSSPNTNAVMAGHPLPQAPIGRKR